MLERDLYTPLIKGAEAEGWLLYRISDEASDFKPGDCMGCASNGKGVLLEVKVLITQSNKVFPWSQFTTRQMLWLRLWATIGGYALAALYEETQKQMRLFRIGPEQVKRGITTEEINNHLLHLDNKWWRGWEEWLALYG